MCNTSTLITYYMFVVYMKCNVDRLILINTRHGKVKNGISLIHFWGGGGGGGGI